MAQTTKGFDLYLKSQVDWELDGPSIEIENHHFESLIPGVVEGHMLPKGGRDWLRGLMFLLSEEALDEVKERIQATKPKLRWTTPRASELILPVSASKPRENIGRLSSGEHDSSRSTERAGDWVNRPIEILSKLETPATSEKDRLAAILFAETKPFDGDLRPRLLIALHQFIEVNRLTEDADRMIYLCSAIRKYSMNMGQDQIDAYSEWLLPTDTAAVHHEVEMEFVKGLSYRLQFEKLTLPQESPNALEILSDIAFGYLRKSLVLQKSYANTAMFVIICISILESLSDSHDSITEELLSKVESLGIAWFQEMVEDNLAEAAEFMQANNPNVAVKLHSLLGIK
jgi:hypothetical protein